MKAFMVLVGLAVCSLFLISGCGSGSAGMTGTLNVTGSNVSSTDTTSKVSFTITYTHPTADSVGGLRYTYTLFVDGVQQLGFPVEEQMNDNGTGRFTRTLSWDILKTSATQTVRLVATTDNLTSSDSVTVTALTVLEILPVTDTFLATDAIGTSKVFSISGGSSPYSIQVNQSVAGLVTVIPTASSVSLTRASAAAGTVTIIVTDNIGTVVQAQAILQAIP